jgi:hypothetical protein
VKPNSAPLATALARALDTGTLGAIAGMHAADDGDACRALLEIYDLWLAPVGGLGDRVRFQNHPVVAALKARLETRFTTVLDGWVSSRGPLPTDPCAALRHIARHADDGIYDWLATSADWDQLVAFLAVEGGPDGGFDDLVALCQVGVTGPAKVTLGANYWDEMGRGDPAAVHTVLHDRLVAAIDMPTIPRGALPVAALQRSALNGLLATNRRLQPELRGALGLLELQAGPRCRRVVRALERLGAPADALPFYAEHAATDPRHGKEWLDGAVRPVVADHPEWAARIVRGAEWRAETNRRLFAALRQDLDASARPARSA